MRGWSQNPAPPDTWTQPCGGTLPDDERRLISDSFLAEIDAWYPGIGQSRPLEVDTGAIVAYGSNVIDEKRSGLRNRSRVGMMSVDGYYSVETGLPTTAPRFSFSCSERVLMNAGGRFASAGLLPPDRIARSGRNQTLETVTDASSRADGAPA